MKIKNISERKIRYLFTFLFWNNILSLLLSLAMYDLIRSNFFETFICILAVSHVTALVCLLAVDLSKPALRHIFGQNELTLFVSYFIPVLLALVPGLIVGFYSSIYLANLLNIDWHPHMLEIIKPGIIFGVLVFLLNLLYFGLALSLRIKHQKELELKTTHNLLLESKLQVLISELNPHLLFNSLNTIIEVLRQDKNLAENMLLKLSDYYQSILIAFDSDSIQLSEELMLCSKYLEMQNERYPHLDFEYQVSDPSLLVLRLPPLILQPLIENSLKHGFKNMPTDALKHIKISIQMSGMRLKIEVIDNGIANSRFNQIIKGQMPHGFKNCESRLKWFFGNSCVVSLKRDPERTSVSLDIPYVSPPKSI